MSGDDDRVVPFVPGTPSMAFREHTDHKRAFCQHWRIAVDQREPMIECRDCGAIVDPYHWLRQSIRNWDAPIRDREAKIRQLDNEIEGRKKALRLLRKESADEAEKRQAARAIAVLPNGRTHR